MRLLLIEDELDTAAMLKKALEQERYTVDIAHDGETGSRMALQSSYDLVILDVRLPAKDGWAVCREFRRAGMQTPILMLTASGSYADRVKGLDLGADDYVVKPFDLNELFARVRALLRRPLTLPDPVIRIDSLEIDTRSRTAKRLGSLIPLTAREYSLLEYLARNKDTLLTRDVISEQVWNTPYDSFSNVIEEYIKRLRKKIDAPGEKELIYGRRGEGYILTAEEFA